MVVIINGKVSIVKRFAVLVHVDERAALSLRQRRLARARARDSCISVFRGSQPRVSLPGLNNQTGCTSTDPLKGCLTESVDDANLKIAYLILYKHSCRRTSKTGEESTCATDRWRSTPSLAEIVLPQKK